MGYLSPWGPLFAPLFGPFTVLRGRGNSKSTLAASSAAGVFAGTAIPVASHKTEGPSTLVTFLGIVVDTVQFQLWLPLEKVTWLRILVVDWCQKRSCTHKELVFHRPFRPCHNRHLPWADLSSEPV